MKLMIINNKNSRAGIFTRLLKSTEYEDCTVLFAMEILNRERPGLVYTNLFKPVNGENDVVTMLSSMDMNTRLRVFIFDTELVKEQLKDNIKNFLPGKDQHKLETP
jgi:hypothetical protein